MTREIKFRAWDNERKEMLFLQNIKGYTIPIEDKNNYFTNFRFLNPFKFGISCINIMEFTGLKDKTGKDIYEGDKVISHTLLTYVEGEVIFEQGSFCIKITKTDSKTYDVNQTPELNNFDYIKITGNIYEEK